MNVGVKQLKNSLSEYLRAVRRGEVVQMTERGKVVAEIRGRTARAGDDERMLMQLEREGVVTRGRGKLGDAPAARVGRGVRASKMVVEDRG